MQERDNVRSKTATNIIKILIIICLFTLAFLIWLLHDAISWIVVVTIMGTLLLLWVVIEYKNKIPAREEPQYPQSPISCFSLISEAGGREKEWYVSGATSFLVGKSTADTEVDIELGDTQYSTYVSCEHAAINLVTGCWYIEDLDSENGVGIRRRNDEYVYRLKPGNSYEIDVGDVIYISKAKILVM